LLVPLMRLLGASTYLERLFPLQIGQEIVCMSEKLSALHLFGQLEFCINC
jgi:hypothetical protein